MPTTYEEEVELAPGIFQILKCTDYGDGRIEKVDAGKKKINGVEMDKRKKHDKPWVWITLSQPQINLGEDVIINLKITDIEDVNGTVTQYTGNQSLPVECDNGSDLLLNISFVNGIGLKTVTPSVAGVYTIHANRIRKAQSLNDITLEVFNP